MPVHRSSAATAWHAVVLAAEPSDKPDLDVARRVIRAEIEGLKGLAEALDGAFETAVGAFAGVRGRVIVTGVGKSGHVGRKIAATLASTGTPAQFVHPVEASHGDLGMIGAADAILALSNSGETSPACWMTPEREKRGSKKLNTVGERRIVWANVSSV